jgi:hypothetical protein
MPYPVGSCPGYSKPSGCLPGPAIEEALHVSSAAAAAAAVGVIGDSRTAAVEALAMVLVAMVSEIVKWSLI